MDKYESIFVINPEVGEERRTELINKTKTIITSGGGKLLSLDEWGLKRMAYSVKGCEEGYYCFLNLEAGPSVIESLERNYRTIEGIIKYLSVRVEDRKPKPRKVKSKRIKPREYRPHIQKRGEYERSL